MGRDQDGAKERNERRGCEKGPRCSRDGNGDSSREEREGERSRGFRGECLQVVTYSVRVVPRCVRRTDGRSMRPWISNETASRSPCTEQGLSKNASSAHKCLSRSSNN